MAELCQLRTRSLWGEVMSPWTHTPILLDEVCSFVPHGQVVYLDLTLGRAGHASKILAQLDKGSVFVGVDRDQEAIQESKKRLESFAGIRKHFLQVQDSQCFDAIKRLGIDKADFILMDIGVSSPQFDDPKRGFSYRNDGPLDMRMDQSKGKTARDILMDSTQEELQSIFQSYGQCPSSRLVAREIVRQRPTRQFETTLQFVDFLKDVLPSWEKNRKGHPAKQYFLALRYAVNDERTELEETLRKALAFLNPGGRLVVIAFNYSEDKIVKDLFREKTQRKAQDKYLPPSTDEVELDYQLLTRKPILPGEQESEKNPRSKSAILRAIERR